jgi:hypothetical protein
MAEYIKREAAVKSVLRMRKPENSVAQNRMLSIIQMDMLKLPAADVAPVVRCKDCKHYRNYPNGLCYLHTEPKTNARGYSGEAVCVEPDDFCSYGERKKVE